MIGRRDLKMIMQNHRKHGEGKTVIDPYTGKLIDAKLYRQGQIRAKQMRDGMRKALKEAKRRGVPLSTIIPVS